jgi:dUTP pyrophosphatase
MNALAPAGAVQVAIRRLPHAAGLSLPSYATQASAGLDLLAAIDGELTIAPLRRQLVPTGIALALPDGFEAQVRPRSGLALEFGITVANSPGTIDADYRGEVAVILANLGDTPFTVHRGDRIAQLVIAPVTRADLREVLDLPASARGRGGFGSTGRAAR